MLLLLISDLSMKLFTEPSLSGFSRYSIWFGCPLNLLWDNDLPSLEPDLGDNRMDLEVRGKIGLPTIEFSFDL